MAEKNYNVDDILDEVRTRRRRSGVDTPRTYNPIAEKPPVNPIYDDEPEAEEPAFESVLEEPAFEPAPEEPVFASDFEAEAEPTISFDPVAADSTPENFEAEETVQFSLRQASVESAAPFALDAEQIDLPDSEVDRAPNPAPPPRMEDTATLDFEPLSKPKEVDSDLIRPFAVDTADISVNAPMKIAGGSPMLPGDAKAIEEKYQFLKKKRKPVIDTFVLTQELDKQIPDSPVPEEASAEDSAEVEDDLFEFNHPEEAPVIRSYLTDCKKRLKIRMLVTGICAAILLWIALLPSGLDPQADPVLYTVMPLVFLVISAGISYPIFWNGLMQLIRLRASEDSITMLAALVSVIQCIILLTAPSSIVEYAIQPMCCLPAITLFANALGKYLNLTRTLSGFNRLTRSETNHAGAVLSHKLASEFSQIAEIDAPIAGVSVEAEFLTNYLEISSTEDPSDRMARTLCPVTTLGCLALFVFSLLFTHSLPMAITITAAAFSITAPFSMILCAALPLLIYNRAAGAENAQVAGYGAVEEFEDVDSVVLSANDLFPGGSITLYGIKTLGIDKIDDHILDAASIVCYAKSTLAPIFMQVIEGKTQLLRPVDSVVIENGMGLSGWVNGRRVLVGNRDLLQNHGIDVPSREYEAKFIQDHRDIVYLVTSGEISAMFIVGYAADPQVEKTLGRLLKNNLSMLVCSNDPNITPRKLANIFTFPVNMIRIIPGKSMGRFHELKRKKLRMPANIANDGSMHSFICALSAVRAIRKSLALSTLLQSLAIILGFITVAVVGLTLQQDMGPLTVGNLLVFQSLWSLASLGLPLLRRV